jgi:ribosomal protein S18 acetylase RimI-like enzyme
MRTDLDHPLWHTLTGPLVSFAEGTGQARRFTADVSNLAALAPDSGPDAWYELASLLPERDHVAFFFFEHAPQIPSDAGLRVVYEDDYQQMLCTQMISRVGATRPFIELTPAEADEMIALVELTNPGPFAARTPEVGRYIGVRSDADGSTGPTSPLVAMAGERSRLQGQCEVSAVCTHPDFRGRGLADLLVREIVGTALSRGEGTFLHVRSDNHTAIRAYERIGFTTRRAMRVIAVQKRTR